MSQFELRTSPRLIIGLIVAALGVVFLLDNLEMVEARSVLRLWPAALIAIGVAKLLEGGGGSARRTAAFIWIAAGAILLLVSLRVVWLRWRDILPIALIAIGGWIVLRALNIPRSATAFADSGDTLNALAFMAGITRKSNSKQFRGGEATAVMGACEIDLRDATIAGNEAVLEVFAFWGGIEITVPPRWTVVTTAFPIMGAIEDERKATEARSESETEQRLLIKGLAVMGGVEVRT